METFSGIGFLLPEPLVLSKLLSDGPSLTTLWRALDPDPGCHTAADTSPLRVGLGVQPPIPSWGSMLADGKINMFDKWWMATLPGLAIFVTTLAINLVGDGLRDLLDPYSRTNI